jgi:hypothetical protein
MARLSPKGIGTLRSLHTFQSIPALSIPVIAEYYHPLEPVTVGSRI